jgi:23S rRNA pseudouridine1911/1915/1917 synthase
MVPAPPDRFEDMVREEHDGLRLDVYLADVIEDASRSLLQKLIKGGRVTVNGGSCKRPGRGMTAGDRVTVAIPPPPPVKPLPENIPIEIVYQDADLVVVNKPSGLVVHPAPGHASGTLVNAILYHCPDCQCPGENQSRPGIVHRIDRFTSGLIVVAKTARAFMGLAGQAREHAFDRRYLALVQGQLREDRGRIDVPVGRSLSDPGRMSVTGIRGREAVTRFEVLERFGAASLIALTLETGRTHQIRVHLRYAGHPVLGDPVYGVATYRSWRVPEEVHAALEGIEGQALHAERLGFVHPCTGERRTFTAPPPADFQRALEALRRSAQGGT